MEPVVHGLEAKYGDDIEFVYLDIDDPATAEAKQRFGFRVQPHFILLDGNGEKVAEWFGRVPETTFVTAFETILD